MRANILCTYRILRHIVCHFRHLICFTHHHRNRLSYCSTLSIIAVDFGKIPLFKGVGVVYHCLVGLNGTEHISFLDQVSDFFLPLHHRTCFHGRRKCRHEDWNHIYPVWWFRGTCAATLIGSRCWCT